MKILISWLAYNNDFDLNSEEKVRTEGPTWQFHRHFFGEYDKHLLLSQESSGDLRLEWLINRLKRDFPGHTVQGVYVPIADVIDLHEIRTRLESYLLQLEATHIDAFISPGTPAMQTAWYLLHAHLGLPTRLLQMRDARHTKKGIPELMEVRLEASPSPATAILSEKTLRQQGQRENYQITPSIEPVYSKARKAAATDEVTVLILGETGTGKEHLARYLHDHSARAGRGECITVNCSALGNELLESRLFGYKKGAFTSAEKDTPGLFEAAHRGTIFLDEIGDISGYMQQVLLRVLQDKRISRVGESASRPVDVRVIAATNRDLPALCRAGTFRWDLYFRLAVVELELPSLVARGPDELREMIDFFLKSEKKNLRKSHLLRLDPAARDALLAYPWPGNLRELENLIRRLYVFAEDTVALSDLPGRLTASDETTHSLRWQDVEKAHIERVLRLKKGNQRQALLALGYGSINTLRKKVREYGIGE